MSFRKFIETGDLNCLYPSIKKDATNRDQEYIPPKIPKTRKQKSIDKKFGMTEAFDVKLTGMQNHGVMTFVIDGEKSYSYQVDPAWISNGKLAGWIKNIQDGKAWANAKAFQFVKKYGQLI